MIFRIYTVSTTMEQSKSLVQIISPLLEPEISAEDVNTALSDMEKGYLNGYYYGDDSGLLFSGTEEKGYEMVHFNVVQN